MFELYRKEQQRTKDGEESPQESANAEDLGDDNEESENTKKQRAQEIHQQRLQEREDEVRLSACLHLR